MMERQKTREFSDMPLLSQREARAAGESLYFTGSACDHGHVAPRYARNGKCVVCTRDAWNEWARKRRSTDKFRAQLRVLKVKDPARQMFREVKGRAKTRGIPFTITRSHIVVPESCPCCSRKIQPRTGAFKPGGVASSPSLDRIVPEIGYIPGNVAVICWRCNTLKHDATLDELRNLVRWMEAVVRPKLKVVGSE